MQTTKLSSKGQVVIPEKFRAGLEPGTVFEISRKENLIVLKRVEGLTEEEKREMEELERIWKEVDEGKGVSMALEEFLKEMESW